MKRPLVILITAAVAAALLYETPCWLARRAYRISGSGDHRAALASWRPLQRVPWTRDFALFDSGVAAYRLGRYSAAARLFRQASQNAPAQLRFKALYNLGTTDLTIASASYSTKDGQHHLKEAVRNLREALELRPYDGNTMANLSSASSRLASLSAAPPSPLRKKPTTGTRQAQGEAQQTQQKVGSSSSAPGRSTDRDQAGRRRTAPLAKGEALRLLDEARGREALRSATVAAGHRQTLTPPEKDW